MFHKGQKVTIMNNNVNMSGGWTGFPCEVVSPHSWVGSNQTEVKALAPRPDRPAGWGDSGDEGSFPWDEGSFHWPTADLRPTLMGPLEQYSQDWNLNISGPDFVTRGVPDWMVEIVGESLHKQINEIMDEARDKIAEVVGENYNVSLDHI